MFKKPTMELKFVDLKLEKKISSFLELKAPFLLCNGKKCDDIKC